MSVIEIRQAALSRAVTGQSTANWRAIFEGFIARGIPADDIQPRENVFTYRAWQALGRQVRKGERGIRVCTFAPIKEKRKADGELVRRAGKRPWFTTVFHISQTDPITGVGDALPTTPLEALASNDTADDFLSAA